MGFMREWALRWLRGSLISYVNNKISYAMLVGRIKRCIKSYDVTPSDVRALIEAVIVDPALTASPDEKRKKLEPLLDLINKQLEV